MSTTPPTLTIAEALALGRGPAADITARIAAANTEAELNDLRLAVCSHRQTGALARQFAARRSQLRVAAAKAARAAAPAVAS